MAEFVLRAVISNLAIKQNSKYPERQLELNLRLFFDTRVHIFLKSNSISLVRPLVASAREPSQVSGCLGVC